MKEMTQCLLLLLLFRSQPPATSVSFSFWSPCAHLPFSFVFPYSVHNVALGSLLSVSGCSAPMHVRTIGSIEYQQKQEASQSGMSGDLYLYYSWSPTLLERLPLGEGSTFCHFIELPTGDTLLTPFTYSIQETTHLVKCQANYVDSLCYRALSSL